MLSWELINDLAGAIPTNGDKEYQKELIWLTEQCILKKRCFTAFWQMTNAAITK